MSNFFGGSQSSYQSTPQNLQNPAYTGLAPSIAGGITGLLGNIGLPNPFSVNGAPSSDTTGANPLVAPITGNQTALLSQLMNQSNPSGNGNLVAGGALSNILNPNYPAQLATSPQTQAAISAATQPILSAFQQVTSPSLVGAATQAGQRVNYASPNSNTTTEGAGPGSSAFGRNQVNAETNLEQQVGATGEQIAQNAYQTGILQQGNAISQQIALSSSNIANTINSLQSEALPQMISQYGIQNGLQLYQSQIQTILSALGLGGQISQPALAENSRGSGSSSPGVLQGIGQLFTGAGNVGTGTANFLDAIA